MNGKTIGVLSSPLFPPLNVKRSVKSGCGHTRMCEIHLHSRHSLEPVSRERLSRRFLISTYMASGSIRIQGEIKQISVNSVGRCINVNRIRKGKDLVIYPSQ